MATRQPPVVHAGVRSTLHVAAFVPFFGAVTAAICAEPSVLRSLPILPTGVLACWALRSCSRTVGQGASGQATVDLTSGMLSLTDTSDPPRRSA